ncbi:MAG TPA: SRPBCC family protein [Streptosporangiaceae bacterium]|nr:SRPBCC family protein [Streptosporangiaceae bacterium]
MTRIVTSAVIAATPAAVWRVASDLAAQPDWMRDAHTIRFVSMQTSGVGVVMDCDTRIGPIRLTDRMVVTEWVAGRTIAIRHQGLVSGTGRFTIEPDWAGTRFTWSEDLRFPWALGGPVSAAAARPVLAAIWRRDLSRLRMLAEAAAAPAQDAGQRSTP